MSSARMDQLTMFPQHVLLERKWEQPNEFKKLWVTQEEKCKSCFEMLPKMVSKEEMLLSKRWRECPERLGKCM